MWDNQILCEYDYDRRVEYMRCHSYHGVNSVNNNNINNNNNNNNNNNHRSTNQEPCSTNRINCPQQIYPNKSVGTLQTDHSRMDGEFQKGNACLYEKGAFVASIDSTPFSVDTPTFVEAPYQCEIDISSEYGSTSSKSEWLRCCHISRWIMNYSIKDIPTGQC